MQTMELIKQLFPTDQKYQITNIKEEKQNEEYEGLTFRINTHDFRSRLAKKTPKKKGYFVVFWYKNINNENQAYSFDETPDKVIITILDDDKKGQFIIPKLELLKRGILRTKDTKGKMAIRVYPKWEKELNKNAMKVQKCQEIYFIDLSNEIDSEQMLSYYFE
ncbi:MepB family protein [Ornithinibacillus sp. 4-3]|uniref:MepB family protein n=1 Tax=Ornithinibacillus sp. 4-3 TaxID=3231488 RepID=A0AB39HSQ1_9BACI